MLTNLTSPEALREKARAWIASNGTPYFDLVLRAIERSDAAGDPGRDNPFRRALLAEGAAQLAEELEGRGVRLSAEAILAAVETAEPAEARCPEHKAFYASYCPVCGTARRI